jgi:protein TonB
MTELEPKLADNDTAGPRGGVAEVVFAGDSGRRGLHLGACAAGILAAYGAVIVTAGWRGAPAGRRRAETAARLRDAIAASERVVDLTPPARERAPPTAPRPATRAPAVTRTARAVRTPGPPRPASSAPSAAGRQASLPEEPVDFTASVFIVGGGTAARAAGDAPGGGAGAPVSRDASGPPASRARAVALDQAAWSCPWPAEADAEQVNERTVVLRVSVRPDGRAGDVDVLSDPGLGFGPAARACALATRFEPARDADGRPVAAPSGPIRVHFFR